MNDSWGFNITDDHYKSVKECITLLVRAAGFGGNLLLNIGPLPNGRIQPQFSERLLAMGEWLKTYGPTIYGTQGGYVRPQAWGAMTQKGKQIFVHVLAPPSDTLSIPMPYQVRHVKLFPTGEVNYAVQDGRLILQTGALDPKALDDVVEVDIE
jgi:alpha-L-fucosidase